jgi:hypothetical protein
LHGGRNTADPGFEGFRVIAGDQFVVCEIHTLQCIVMALYY